VSGRDSASDELWREESEMERPVTCTRVYAVKRKNTELHHLQEQHDTWVDRGLACPYCRVGSVIKSREQINEELD